MTHACARASHAQTFAAPSGGIAHSAFSEGTGRVAGTAAHSGGASLGALRVPGDSSSEGHGANSLLRGASRGGLRA